MVKKQKKSKGYRRLQKIIQDLYMMVFISWSGVLVFVSKFSTLKEMKVLIIGVAITGALTIGKGITHYRTNPAKARAEIRDVLSSEKGINF